MDACFLRPSGASAASPGDPQLPLWATFPRRSAAPSAVASSSGSGAVSRRARVTMLQTYMRLASAKDDPEDAGRRQP